MLHAAEVAKDSGGQRHGEKKYRPDQSAHAPQEQRHDDQPQRLAYNTAHQMAIQVSRAEQRQLRTYLTKDSLLTFFIA
jgi:hypothetical protein